MSEGQFPEALRVTTVGKDRAKALARAMQVAQEYFGDEHHYLAAAQVEAAAPTEDMDAPTLFKLDVFFEKHIVIEEPPLGEWS